MAELVYGRQPVKGLLLSKTRILKLYLTDQKDPLLALFGGDAKTVVFLSVRQMDEKFKSANHQNVVAEIASFQYRQLDFLPKVNANETSLVVVLDGIEDPQNFGAIARSAWAANAKAIVIKSDRQVQVNPLAIRASAGYLLAIPVVKVVNVANALEVLKEKGYWIAGAVAGAKDGYDSLDSSVPTVLVVGNEHSGISRIVKEKLDFPVAIPMANAVESLSASSAAAVVLMHLYSRALSAKTGSADSKRSSFSK